MPKRTFPPTRIDSQFEVLTRIQHQQVVTNGTPIYNANSVNLLSERLGARPIIVQIVNKILNVTARNLMQPSLA